MPRWHVLLQKKNVHTKMITDQPVNETFCPDGFVGLNDPECEKKTKINDTIQVTAPDFFRCPEIF